jgi:hypothetical protein
MIFFKGETSESPDDPVELFRELFLLSGIWNLARSLCLERLHSYSFYCCRGYPVWTKWGDPKFEVVKERDTARRPALVVAPSGIHG